MGPSLSVGTLTRTSTLYRQHGEDILAAFPSSPCASHCFSSQRSACLAFAIHSPLSGFDQSVSSGLVVLSAAVELSVEFIFSSATEPSTHVLSFLCKLPPTSVLSPLHLLLALYSLACCHLHTYGRSSSDTTFTCLLKVLFPSTLLQLLTIQHKPLSTSLIDSSLSFLTSAHSSL